MKINRKQIRKLTKQAIQIYYFDKTMKQKRQPKTQTLSPKKSHFQHKFLYKQINPVEEYIELVSLKIKIPKKYLWEIDKLIKEGIFISWEQFIKAAIAETLIKYRTKKE